MCYLLFYFIWLFVVPIGFASAWGFSMKDQFEEDPVPTISTAMTIIVSTAVMLSFSSWYGAQWNIGRLVGFLIIVAALGGWGFALSILVLQEYFSFTGVSSILLSTNFLSAVYIVYKKNVCLDIPLYSLFREIATKLSRPQRRMTVMDKKLDDEKQLDELLSRLTSKENSFLAARMFVAFIFYLIPLAVQAAIILYRADDENKTLGIMNSAFILCSDIVILSLRE